MSRRTRTAGRADVLSARQLALAWQSASLLLGYPDQHLVGRLDIIEQASDELPGDVGGPLRATVDRLRDVALADLEADYVETFDTRRRHNLFLTYFAHGDTRKRGLALLRFKQVYQSCGFDLDDAGPAGPELPDHVCVVLEFAATIDQKQGRQLLLDHRAGLELLRISLAENESRWAGAVEAVTATFPPLQGDEREAIRRLAAEGPPAEEVGLTPYATPGFDPGPAAPDSSAPVLLPMPSFPGSR
jgi:nitrate reductase delta subunit